MNFIQLKKVDGYQVIINIASIVNMGENEKGTYIGFGNVSYYVEESLTQILEKISDYVVC